jgi:outer membrane protein OmpA-like peptidoglycan-associated protein
MRLLNPWSFFLSVLILLSSCAKPLFVTHLSPEGVAMTKKKGWGRPQHKTIFARLMCFDEKCRKKAAWVKTQKKKRFKGYDSGPSLPNRERGVYLKTTDTLVANKKTPVKKPVETAKAAPVVVSEPLVQEKRDSLIVLSEVLFAVNSFHLKPVIYPKLDSVASFVKANPNRIIRVSGHTDNTGGEAHNQKLSENRARVVAEYLVEHGIETSRVSFAGMGSAQPVGDNTTADGRSKNRRVEMLIHENKP